VNGQDLPSPGFAQTPTVLFRLLPFPVAASMEVLSAAAARYTAFVQDAIAAGSLDGDLLLIPTALVYFVIGAVLAHWVFMGPFGALVFGDAAVAVAKPGAAAPPAVSGTNVTRSGMRREAKAAGKKQKKWECPDDLELKMVLVVRKDLKLKAPEVAAYCAQAALDAVHLVTTTEGPPLPKVEAETPAEEALERRAMWRQWLTWWNDEGVAKVVLKAEDGAALSDIAGECASLGLPFVKVADAVVAVGPAPVEDIDEVCGDLKLF
jgi:peptidyl-tRNA hydrolase